MRCVKEQSGTLSLLFFMGSCVTLSYALCDRRNLTPEQLTILCGIGFGGIGVSMRLFHHWLFKSERPREHVYPPDYLQYYYIVRNANMRHLNIQQSEDKHPQP